MYPGGSDRQYCGYNYSLSQRTGYRPQPPKRRCHPPQRRKKVDRKIPADLRCKIPVLEDKQGLLAVAGIGVNLDRAAESLPAWQIKVFSKKYLPAEDTE